jgi:hypothetical protein
MEPRGVQELWFDVGLSSVPGAGRGVFSKRAFRKGDVVMRSPILLFNVADVRPGCVLRDYCGFIGDTAFLCFDYQGLVNRGPAPADNNVQAEWHLEQGMSQYVALRDISPGEELFQDYGSARRA